MNTEILPCGLCGGDGYSPFNILKVCPDCEGLGVVYSTVPLTGENESEIYTPVPNDLNTQEPSLEYEEIPF